MSEEEDISTVQAICAVSKQRAVELLEAASGVVNRAVEIHLQQQQAGEQEEGQSSSIGSRGGSRALNNNVTKIDNGNDEDDEVVVVVVDEGDNNSDPPKKKQRIITTNGDGKKQSAGGGGSDSGNNKKNGKSPSYGSSSSSLNKKQNTLHSFLGIEGKKEQSPTAKKKKNQQQPTIHSFFNKRKSAPPPPEEVVGKSDNKIREAEGVTPSNDDEANEDSGGAKQQPAKKDTSNKTTKPSTPPQKISIPSSPKAKKEEEVPVDPRLSYATLATALSAISSTTKRNAKLNILKNTIKGAMEALGGIGHDGNATTSRRTQDAQTLTYMLELVSGKISMDGSDSVTPDPLQVSGAAVSSAVQIVMGSVSKNSMREAYRRTGDFGDVAAEFFSPKVSVENFFAPRRKSTATSKDSTTTTTTSTTCDNKIGASIVQIHKLFQAVASVPKGTGSQKQRHNILVKLLRLATSKDEMRFLVRCLISNMRLGATMKTILASLAMAVQEIQTMQETSTQDPAIQILQKTYDVCPRLNKIVLSLLCGGIELMVKECSLEIGCPIQPSLANPAHSLEEVERFMMKGGGAASSSKKEKSISSSDDVVVAEVIAEWKYDGVRTQFHYDTGNGGIQKLYSRHLIDNTIQYPDAVQSMIEAKKGSHVSSFIIDAEIVGIARNDDNKKKKDDGTGDGSEWRLLPFQILSTRRGTKNNTDSRAVQIRVFAFDLMYLNGESLIKKSLWERQKLLRENFIETDGFSYAASKDFKVFDESQITTYLQEAVKGGAEGLMLKLSGRAGPPGTEVIPRSIATPYESGNRSTTWLKLKRDYVAGFADTLDVVPIGAWYGNGRKAEKGFLSPILLAVYDEDDGVFRSISRCMSFTDAMYNAIREFYFRGTNYPADVGLPGDETTQKKEAAQVEDSKDDGSGSEAEGDNGNHGTEEGGAETENNSDDDSNNDENNFVGVNCFPGRPPSSVYITNESPTIWFQPKEVWEVSFADLTLSRTHTAAAGLVDNSESRGVALRFPRFKRRRPDKGVEQATTSVQIAQLFTKQFKQG